MLLEGVEYCQSGEPPSIVLAQAHHREAARDDEDQRTAVLQSPPQRYQIVLEPYRQQSETASEYALKAFYEGALGEGAVECR